MMLLAELTYIHIYHKLYKNPKVLELCLPLFTDLAKYGTPPIVDYNCLDFPLENPLPGNPWEAGDFFGFAMQNHNLNTKMIYQQTKLAMASIANC
jgi:hypothetical protein